VRHELQFVLLVKQGAFRLGFLDVDAQRREGADARLAPVVSASAYPDVEFDDTAVGIRVGEGARQVFLVAAKNNMTAINGLQRFSMDSSGSG
jgi:hypothetical protein